MGEPLQENKATPIARREGLVHSEFDDGGLIVYDTDVNHAHHLNPEAARIWEACDGTRTVAAICRHCALPEAAVWQGLVDLEESELLLAPVEPPPATTRRGVLKTAAMTTAAVVGIPAIVSMAVPAVALAYTCATPLQHCNPDVGTSFYAPCGANCTCTYVPAVTNYKCM